MHLRGGVPGRSPATSERSQPDATFTYSYNATVSASAQGDTPTSLANDACYNANSEDQPDVVFHGCDPATVVVPPAPPAPEPAELGVVKTVSHDIVAPGDTLTWTVVGTNYGPATSTGFVLADQLPAGVQFVRATASGALTCTTPAVGSSGAVTCTAPSVPAAPAAGSSLTLTIVANGTVDNRRRHAPAQHRHRVRRSRRAGSRPAPQPRRDADAGARSRPADPAQQYRRADAPAPGARRPATASCVPVHPPNVSRRPC